MAHNLGALRDYCVAEGLELSHPIGNPIIHSTNRGDRRPPEPPAMSCKIRHPGCLRMEGDSWFAVTVGVGNIPRRANVSRLGLSLPVRPAAPPLFDP